jgi:hypothetical protein
MVGKAALGGAAFEGGMRAAGSLANKLSGKKSAAAKATGAAPAKPAAKPAAPVKPAADASRPTSSASPKPTAPTKPAVKQTGDKAKDMATWSKANPSLANKPKTPNPLMKDMPGDTLKKAQEAPKPQMSARAQALKAGGPSGSARSRVLNQDVDIFDLIKGHLIGEGYAETEENALIMMANMSEDWRSSILDTYGVEILDEAQEARENPEDHDKEEKKKYEKVRGEKTPMPPRGDKRREDFEKWYAKQMGR